MTDPGVSPDDMLSFPWRSRTDISQVGDGALDALLARDLGPEETAAALRPVTELLAALRGTPSGGELAGLDRALAEFHRAGSMPDGSRRSHPRRRALRRTPLSAKLAGAMAAAVLVGGSIATAYADMLPAALQKFAHAAIAAPATNSSPSPGETRRARVPAGPGPSGPSGPAAHGLCSAYARAEAHGSAAQRDVAFRKLVAAVGGADKVAAYCATVRGPSAGPTGHATGRPTARPSRPVKTPPGKHKGEAAAR
jgi:hypothetical protein